jgi:hypothetical protein
MPHQDWAYLVLDQCLGLEYGYLVPRALDLEDSNGAVDGFSALGYSTGRQMMDPACSMHADRTWSGAESWLHDCVLEAGDSGGPIVPRGTLSVVALSASVRGDPHCPAGGAPHGPAPLARLSALCANVAVPLARDIIIRIEAARTAVGVQRALIAAGYDAGPLGAIDEPRAIAAIRQAQSDMGWAVTGQPTEALHKILWMNLRTS